MLLSSLIVILIVCAIFLAFPTVLVAMFFYTRDDIKTLRKPNYFEIKSRAQMKARNF